MGISHYLRMLKNAVEELTAGGKAEVEEEINVEILLPVEALLPTTAGRINVRLETLSAKSRRITIDRPA